MESLHSSRIAAGGQVGYLKASQAALDADTQAEESSCHSVLHKEVRVLTSLTCSEDEYLTKIL